MENQNSVKTPVIIKVISCVYILISFCMFLGISFLMYIVYSELKGADMLDVNSLFLFASVFLFAIIYFSFGVLKLEKSSLRIALAQILILTIGVNYWHLLGEGLEKIMIVIYLISIIVFWKYRKLFT